jgi:hypothetical protein
MPIAISDLQNIQSQLKTARRKKCEISFKISYDYNNLGSNLFFHLQIHKVAYWSK